MKVYFLNGNKECDYFATIIAKIKM